MKTLLSCELRNGAVGSGARPRASNEEQQPINTGYFIPNYIMAVLLGGVASIREVGIDVKCADLGLTQEGHEQRKDDELGSNHCEGRLMNTPKLELIRIGRDADQLLIDQRASFDVVSIKCPG